MHYCPPLPFLPITFHAFIMPFTFFAYRPGSPASYQLVSIDHSTAWYSTTAKTPELRFVFPTNFEGVWDVKEIPELTEAEEAAARVRCVEGLTRLVLELRENPRYRYRICKTWNGTKLPKRGAYEVSLQDAAGRGSIDITSTTNVARCLLYQWYETRGVMLPEQFIQPAPIVRARARTDSPVRLPSFPSVPFPPINTHTDNHKISPLTHYVAKLVLEALLVKNKHLECPVSMEPLETFSTVCVSNCGHVCSEDAAKQMVKCPLCRQSTAWCTVEMKPIQ